MGRFPGGADDCLSLFLAVGAVISGNAWLSKSQMGHEQRGTVRPCIHLLLLQAGRDLSIRKVRNTSVTLQAAGK